MTTRAKAIRRAVKMLNAYDRDFRASAGMAGVDCECCDGYHHNVSAKTIFEYVMERGIGCPAV